jgi:hypothetical protein
MLTHLAAQEGPRSGSYPVHEPELVRAKQRSESDGGLTGASTLRPTGASAHDHLLLVDASQVCAPGRGLQGPAQAEWLQRPGMLLYVCARSRSSSVRARAHARA